MKLKLKKCITCKESKINAENYIRLNHGRYSKVCNDCREKRKNAMPPTQKEIQELFKYNPLSGKITDKDGKNVLFYDKTNDTVFIKVNGKKHTASKIIWLYINGYIPKTVFYVNGNRQDLTLSNLITKRPVKVRNYSVNEDLEGLTPKEVLAIAKEQEAKKKFARVPTFKGYRLCEVK